MQSGINLTEIIKVMKKPARDVIAVLSETHNDMYLLSKQGPEGIRRIIKKLAEKKAR